MKCTAGLLAIALSAVGMPAFAQGYVAPAIVYSTGGKADHSLNESAGLGVRRFSTATQIAVAEFEPADETQFEPAVRRFAEGGRNPIIAVGFLQAAALAKVAREFPDRRFTFIDGLLPLPNIRSITFRDQESSFLVGMVAALVSKSGKVGFIGGMESPLMHRFQCGYEQGVKHANARAEIVANMTGTTPAAWDDPARGAQLAKAQFDRGVDVVYAAAGTTGLGVLEAAKTNGKYAIGSANKHFPDDGTVLTSTVKHLDFAIFQEFSLAVNGLQDGGWKAGHSTLGLKESAVDWAKDYNEKLVTPDIKKKVDAAKSDIIEGKLAVYDYMASNSCKR
jgi:basic membrane protein A